MTSPKRKTTNRKGKSTSFFARNKRLVIIAAAFALVGVAALVRSFAATPDACTNSNVKVFNSGPCVQIVKALVNTNAGSKVVDSGNPGFDGTLNNALIDLNNRGIFAACGGYATPSGVTPCLYNLMKDRAAIINSPPANTTNTTASTGSSKNPPAPTATNSTTNSTRTSKNPPARTYQTITNLDTSKAKKVRVNVWVKNDKLVAPAGNSGNWDIHVICDIDVYPNVGKYGVWTYWGPEQQTGGDDKEACSFKRNSAFFNTTTIGACSLASETFCRGSDGIGDKYIPAQLAKQGYKNYLRYKGPGVY